MRRSSPLLILTLIAACNADYAASDRLDPKAGTCPEHSVSVVPTDGADSVFFLDPLIVASTTAAPDLRVRLVGESGDEVPLFGSVTDDGHLWEFAHNGLEPNAEYRIELTSCAGKAESWFRTSDFGHPVDEPVVLEGRTFALDWSQARFLEPQRLGDLLLGPLDDLGLLIRFDTLDAGRFDLTATRGALEDDAWSALPCAGTTTLPAGMDFGANPVFVVEAPSLHFDWATVGIDVYDVQIRGALSSTGDDAMGISGRATLDTRRISTWIRPDMPQGWLCQEMTWFGVECGACKRDGQPYCLPVDVRNVRASYEPDVMLPPADAACDEP